MMLNAVYSGSCVAAAKAEFSNSQNANLQKRNAYIWGSVNRQHFLKRTLEWISRGDPGSYASQHRTDTTINELNTYFNTVIDWVSWVPCSKH